MKSNRHEYVLQISKQCVEICLSKHYKLCNPKRVDIAVKKIRSDSITDERDKRVGWNKIAKTTNLLLTI